MKKTLVVMAAGMGSRFGGIKQLEPVGPSGEIILDYSVYDAIEAGFEKVVFIIRKDIEEDFKKVIGDKLSQHVEVEYVLQDLNNLPEGYTCPAERKKPWGTGQAVLSCYGVVDGSFAVINADDYYGKEGFCKIYQFLDDQENADNADGKYHFCMAGFWLGNTLSPNGTVTRGICEVDKNGYLMDVKETGELKQNGDSVSSENGEYPMNQPVSMNMWGFSADFIEELNARFATFLDGIEGNELKAEYLLPGVVDDLIKENKAVVKVLDTRDKWFGVTYREDKDSVCESFRNLVKEGVYPAKLFS
ncbi:MAG: nucleotidyltransferase [Lachnospiraceae bacterium]|nr:nucleotidyltransferase [Lachnospiraceae bacterium]